MQARNCNPGAGLETNQSTAQIFAVLALILVIGGPKGSTEEGKKHQFCVPFVVHEPRYAAFVLSPTGVHNFGWTEETVSYLGSTTLGTYLGSTNLVDRRK